MTFNKRKKNSRQRGTHTHGWGAKKKHRGSGHRGGCGNAGSGKRADSKKPSNWKDPDYFGKIGFKKKGQILKINAINVSSIELHADNLISKKLMEKKGDAYTIDLEKIGCNKLLSTGKVTKKLLITTAFASQNAIEKVKAAGGEVNLTIKPTNEPKEAN